jgi:hypothetical protein
MHLKEIFSHLATKTGDIQKYVRGYFQDRAHAQLSRRAAERTLQEISHDH